MLLKIIQAGQPALRMRAKRLTKQQLASAYVQELIDSMIATLHDAPGVGLAAPQVGEPLQIVIIDDKATYHDIVPPILLKEQGRKATGLKVLINPKLEIVEDETATYFEGCLSVDGYFAVVPRVKSVKVSALDRTGKPISYTAQDWHARILQHEIDHLHGKLYVDSMIPASLTTTKNFALRWRKKLEKEIKEALSKYSGAN